MPVLRVSNAIAGMKNSAARSSRGVLKAATSPWVPPKAAAAAAATTTAAPTQPDAPIKPKIPQRAYHFSTPSSSISLSLSSRIHIASQLKQQREQQQNQHQQNHRRICTVPNSWHNINNNPLSRPLAPPQQVLQGNIISTIHNNSSHHHQTVHKRWHGGPQVDHDHADSVHLTFVDGDGNPVLDHVDAYVGESLLQVAQRNDIELEGACEGVCACSTCHVIIPDWETFDNVLEEASEDEEDMLDMAFGLTETSRLGCQIIITEEMDDMKIEIPRATRNFYVDGHVPVPH